MKHLHCIARDILGQRLKTIITMTNNLTDTISTIVIIIIIIAIIIIIIIIIVTFKPT